MEKEKIVGLGELLWDVFPDGKALGGAPVNFACHASQFGFEGCAVSAVGKDDLGQEILDTLAGKGLVSLVEPVDYPTGTVQVTLDAQGVPRYEICEGVAWDNIPFTPQMERLARECRAVCFGSLAQRGAVSRATIRRFLGLVAPDAYRIFDINLRQHYYDREVVADSLGQCNVLKINDEEVAAVARLFGFSGFDEQEVCRRLLREYDLELVIETRGAAGSYVFTADETSRIETPRVEVVDTVGAGDSFAGAFVASLLRGSSLREAHRTAVDVAAYVCTQKGAMPRLPERFVGRLKG